MSTLLRPSPIRIILALVLFALSTYLWHLYVISTISDTFPWGFPLEFYTAWGPCPPGEICSESNGLFLILDLVFWYLLSGLLVPKPGMKEMKREEVQKAYEDALKRENIVLSRPERQRLLSQILRHVLDDMVKKLEKRTI